MLAVGYAWVPAEAESDLAAIAAEALSDAVAESVDPASQVKVTPTAREGHAANGVELRKFRLLVVLGARYVP